MSKSTKNDELTLLRERYTKRNIDGDARYNPLSPDVYLSRQERERALIRVLQKYETGPIKDKTLLEIGCGNGLNILQLIRLGFHPANLAANELLPDRMAMADRNLPVQVERWPGDATTLDIENESFDFVYQSTVFSSILDDEVQSNLAREMWRWVKPGGGIIWYDFVYDNPSNPDVRGVGQKRVRGLFPHARILARRVTLAPPISRQVVRLHPVLYSLFNSVPFLRTHILCWIGKESGNATNDGFSDHRRPNGATDVRAPENAPPGMSSLGESRS